MAGMVGLVGQCGKERFYEEFGIASETYTDVYACLSFKNGSALSLENGRYLAHPESRRDAEYASFVVAIKVIGQMEYIVYIGFPLFHGAIAVLHVIVRVQ